MLYVNRLSARICFTYPARDSETRGPETRGTRGSGDTGKRRHGDAETRVMLSQEGGVGRRWTLDLSLVDINE